MPLMKLAKNRVYASTLGHTIRFVKDEPVFVPPIMKRECEGIGAVLVDKDNKIIDTSDVETEVAEGLTASINAAKEQEGIAVKNDKASQPAAPMDRMAAILKGVKNILGRNDRLEFTAAGHVKLAALSKEAGFRVDKNELKEAMSIINDPD